MKYFKTISIFLLGVAMSLTLFAQSTKETVSLPTDMINHVHVKYTDPSIKMPPPIVATITGYEVDGSNPYIQLIITLTAATTSQVQVYFDLTYYTDFSQIGTTTVNIILCYVNTGQINGTTQLRLNGSSFYGIKSYTIEGVF